ncbi:MAG: hypothetical protein IJF57_00840 [Clostridia bacterium]|nr:hypothetical protein [Clostridia bacterium]
MKCSFCGAVFDESEELCPECGKYISENFSQELSEDKSEENPLGEFIDSFDYKDSSVIRSVCFAIPGLLLAAPMIFEIIKLFVRPYYSMFMYFSKSDIKIIVLFVLGMAIIIASIALLFTSKKCFVSVYENGISGIVPKNPFKAVPFDIMFNDIKELKRMGFYSLKEATPVITVKTADIKIRISLPEKKYTIKISDYFYNLCDK